MLSIKFDGNNGRWVCETPECWRRRLPGWGGGVYRSRCLERNDFWLILRHLSQMGYLSKMKNLLKF